MDATQETPLEKAVRLAGGRSALGRKLGISHEAVRKLLAGTIKLDGDRALEIERVLDGQVTRDELLPHLYAGWIPESTGAPSPRTQ